jgi:hypothetical protein
MGESKIIGEGVIKYREKSLFSNPNSLYGFFIFIYIPKLKSSY